KRGVIDGRVASVTNNLLPNYNGESNQFNNVQSYIGIGIRSYRKLVQLDPDFSVLIDQRPAEDSNTSVCSSSPKSKISKAQLAGIIIGSVAFAAIIVTMTAYALYKRKERVTLENKLRTL
ncbi:hypothetical protein CYY_009947, partial [Polysphondylium violaceum]